MCVCVCISWVHMWHQYMRFAQKHLYTREYILRPMSHRAILNQCYHFVISYPWDWPGCLALYNGKFQNLWAGKHIAEIVATQNNFLKISWKYHSQYLHTSPKMLPFGALGMKITRAIGDCWLKKTTHRTPNSSANALWIKIKTYTSTVRFWLS